MNEKYHLWWIWITLVCILWANIGCLKVLRHILEVISK